MPNGIKYSTSAQTLALKQGNYWISTGDVDKGPTSSSDYWNGITPPSGGYTIYLNKASNGPSIYTAANDSELISLTNRIANASHTTVAECFNYFRSQNDKMVFNRDYEAIVTDGLVLCLDAGFRPSYTTSGTTWYDISSGGNNGTLTNGPTFNSDNGGSIVFDGSNDYVSVGNSLAFNNISVCIWMYQTGTGFRCPISNEPAGGSLNGWAIRQRSSTYWAVIGREGSSDFANGGSVNLNVWTYLCNTYNGTTITLYQNGSSAATAASSRTVNTTTNLTIASLPSLGEFFQGRIGVVQVYNRALSATEVLQNFNAQKARFGL